MCDSTISGCSGLIHTGKTPSATSPAHSRPFGLIAAV
jgi:hypothetical protein